MDATIYGLGFRVSGLESFPGAFDKPSDELEIPWVFCCLVFFVVGPPQSEPNELWQAKAQIVDSKPDPRLEALDPGPSTLNPKP